MPKPNGSGAGLSSGHRYLNKWPNSLIALDISLIEKDVRIPCEVHSDRQAGG